MSEILEVNGKKYVGVDDKPFNGCDGCHFEFDWSDGMECAILDNDCRCSNKKLTWKEVKMNNNNDLSNVEVGDYIWTIQFGWDKVIGVMGTSYPISTDHDSYTIDGKQASWNKHPSAWLKPPECFNAEPKPCEFKKGDKVLVSNSLDADLETWIKAYFSHATGGDYVCVYLEGMTEWSSDGAVERWNFCQKA